MNNFEVSQMLDNIFSRMELRILNRNQEEEKDPEERDYVIIEQFLAPLYKFTSLLNDGNDFDIEITERLEEQTEESEEKAMQVLNRLFIEANSIYIDPMNLTSFLHEYVYIYTTPQEQEFLDLLPPLQVIQRFFRMRFDLMSDSMSLSEYEENVSNINRFLDMLESNYQEQLNPYEDETEDQEYRRILQESFEEAYSGHKTRTYKTYSKVIDRAFKDAYSGIQPVIDKKVLPFTINVISRQTLGVLDFGEKIENKLKQGCRSGDCPICKFSLQSSESIAMLDCRHCLHTECLYRYLMTSLNCPICRNPIKEIYISVPLMRRYSDTQSRKKTLKRYSY